MSSASSNHAAAAGRAIPPLYILLIGAAALLLLPIAGCSSAGANAPEAAAAAATASSVSSSPAVEQTLVTSCFDCHSEQGTGPWNARLAPSYLFGAGDARHALNFSQWGTYSSKKKKAEMAKITKVIEGDEMPPWDYELLHPVARLSPKQHQQLLQWALREQNTLAQ